MIYLCALEIMDILVLWDAVLSDFNETAGLAALFRHSVSANFHAVVLAIADIGVLKFLVVIMELHVSPEFCQICFNDLKLPRCAMC